MRIQNQPQTQYKYGYKPNFTAYWQNIKSIHGKPISENNTAFFRTDLDWDSFTQKLIEKYKNTDKVNIHCFGCSDGVEPFSLAMLLIKKLGEKGAKKFFPIIASDIDPKILENPKKGLVRLSDSDLENIEENLGKDYSKFIKHDDNFKIDKSYNSDEEICDGQIAQVVRDAVEFRNYDLKSNISSLPRTNTVVMARNFWPYIPNEDQPKIAKALGNRLGNNSMITTGSYDTSKHVNAEQLLRENMFNMTDVRYCLEKPNTKETRVLSNPEYLMNTFAKKK